MNRKVDPAALLLAVLGVGIGALNGPGPWDNMDTIVAVAVGVVLFAFTWPRKENPKDKSQEIGPVDSWVIAAHAVVYGLIITTGIAWPLQSIWKLPACPPACAEADRIVNRATYLSVGIGIVCAATLFVVLKRTITRLTPKQAMADKSANASQPSEPEAKPEPPTEHMPARGTQTGHGEEQEDEPALGGPDVPGQGCGL